jgi:hypothetical protein
MNSISTNWMICSFSNGHMQSPQPPAGQRDGQIDCKYLFQGFNQMPQSFAYNYMKRFFTVLMALCNSARPDAASLMGGVCE